MNSRHIVSRTLIQNEQIRKLIFLHVPILLCLYILTDNDTQHSSTRHLAVFTALSRHPPSMRVFRGLLSICLLGFCISALLLVLEYKVGREMLDKLFFSTPYTLLFQTPATDDNGSGYKQTRLQQESDDEEEDNDDISEDESDSDNGEEYDHLGEKHVVQSGNHIKPLVAATTTTSSTTSSSSSPAATISNMSLDVLLLILVALFLFTISSSAGGKYTDQKSADFHRFFAKLGDVAAPTFPLLLFFICAAKSLFPWRRQKYYFWTVICYTLGAPMYEVQFRDGFIGDVFTSMVRPMQDIAFTCFYLLSGLQGWWMFREQTSEENINIPVERSWLLHTVVLPACTVSPLWWRFCQCLRQCYDTKKRWPYLGNAAKYFFAAQVAMFGVFDPEKTGSAVWIIMFVLATFYQLWWDIFMDWELLEWHHETGSYKLRKTRLFQSDFVYICIFLVNFVLRFGWTLIVMPTTYLSPSGALLNTFSADFTTLVTPLLTCAEIIRRTLWGLIRIELEVIKIQEKEEQEEDLEYYSTTASKKNNRNHLVLTPMNVESSSDGNDARGSNLKAPVSVFLSIKNDLSSANDIQVLWELCVYATIFTCMGIIAATHRQVL
jgi:EXS domain-containing protein